MPAARVRDHFTVENMRAMAMDLRPIALTLYSEEEVPEGAAGDQLVEAATCALQRMAREVHAHQWVA